AVRCTCPSKLLGWTTRDASKILAGSPPNAPGWLPSPDVCGRQTVGRMRPRTQETLGRPLPYLSHSMQLHEVRRAWPPDWLACHKHNVIVQFHQTFPEERLINQQHHRVGADRIGNDESSDRINDRKLTRDGFASRER